MHWYLLTLSIQKTVYSWNKCKVNDEFSKQPGSDKKYTCHDGNVRKWFIIWKAQYAF